MFALPGEREGGKSGWEGEEEHGQMITSGWG